MIKSNPSFFGNIYLSVFFFDPWWNLNSFTCVSATSRLFTEIGIAIGVGLASRLGGFGLAAKKIWPGYFQWSLHRVQCTSFWTSMFNFDRRSWKITFMKVFMAINHHCFVRHNQFDDLHNSTFESDDQLSLIHNMFQAFPSTCCSLGTNSYLTRIWEIQNISYYFWGVKKARWTSCWCIHENVRHLTLFGND